MPFAAAALAALVLCAPPSKAQPGWELRWKKAKALTAALDFNGALPLLKALAAEPELLPEPRAQVLLELGLTFVNLGDDAAARGAFARALTFDPKAALDALAPPKAVQLHESERAKLPSPEPVPASADPAPIAAAPAPEPAPAPAAAEVRPVKLVAAREPSRFRVTLPVVVFTAAAAVSLAIGVGLGLESQRVAAQASGSRHAAAEVEALLGRRATLGSGSVVAYVATGALAVVAAVLFALGADAPAPIALEVRPDGFVAAFSAALP